MNIVDKYLLDHGYDLYGKRIPNWRPKGNTPKRKSRPKKKVKQLTPEQEKKILNKNKGLLECRAKAEMSPAEERIAKFLHSNGVEFMRECHSPKLTNDRTGRLLFFDFYVPSLRLVIEFDGLHHYKDEDRARLKRQRARDHLKNNFCSKHKFHLLRIKYTQSAMIEEILCKKFDELSPVIS